MTMDIATINLYGQRNSRVIRVCGRTFAEPHSAIHPRAGPRSFTKCFTPWASAKIRPSRLYITYRVRKLCW